MNNCTLIGNLGKDAEVKQFNDRYKISFSIATSEKRKNGDRTDWHNINYWSNSNKVAEYLTKGKKVAVSGAYRTDKTDKGYYSYLDAFRLELLGTNNGNDNQNNDNDISWLG